MNYYPFHIGDYLSATRHLSWEEDAAYRRMLDTYYTTEKPLPLDLRSVCRLVLATNETQRQAVETVLSEFFEQTPGGWVNRRADAEIDAMREKQQKQRDKANKRWNKPAAEPGNATAGAPAMPRHEGTDATASKADAMAMPPTPTPTPIPTPEEKKKTPAKPARFDPLTIDLPAAVSSQAWGDWIAYRKTRKLSTTEQTAKAQLKKLADWAAKGHKPETIIADSIANGWQGLFEPKGETSKPAGKPRVYHDIRNMKYTEGVNDDLSF